MRQRIITSIPMVCTAAYMITITAGYIAFRWTTRLPAYRITSINQLLPFITLASISFYCYFAAVLCKKSTWTTVDHVHEPIYQAQLARAAQLRPSFIQPPDPKDENPSCLIPCIETKLNNCRRFCRSCSAFKPDRTHHCHTCKRCLLGSDHHCVFLNNCIALHNRKLFILFLFYASLTCMYMCCEIILKNPAQIIEQRNMFVAMLVVALFVMSTASGLAVFAFMSLHLWLIAKNITTIDMMEKQKERKHRMAHPINPFYISLLDNVRAVMGPVWCWLLPVNIRVSHKPGPHERNPVWQEMRDAGVISDVHPDFVHPQIGWFGLSAPESESTRDDDVIVENDAISSDSTQDCDETGKLRQRLTKQL